MRKNLQCLKINAYYKRLKMREENNYLKGHTDGKSIKKIHVAASKDTGRTSLPL